MNNSLQPINNKRTIKTSIKEMNGERDQRRTGPRTSNQFAAYSEMKGVSVVGARHVRTKEAVNERRLGRRARKRKEKARGAASREACVMKSTPLRADANGAGPLDQLPASIHSTSVPLPLCARAHVRTRTRAGLIRPVS